MRIARVFPTKNSMSPTDKDAYFDVPPRIGLPEYDEVHISVAFTWDLKKAERCLGVTLIDKHRGGRAGGQTTLSTQGRKWAKAYELFRRDIEKTVEEAYTKHFKGLAR